MDPALKVSHNVLSNNMRHDAFKAGYRWPVSASVDTTGSHMLNMWAFIANNRIEDPNMLFS